MSELIDSRLKERSNASHRPSTITVLRQPPGDTGAQGKSRSQKETEMKRNGKTPDLERKIVILGAGPTGLGAAYRLQEMGYRNWAIYERHSYIGGLATSFQDSAGFTYDIGGHVMFSHYKYFDDLVSKLLGDNYTEIMREAWVWMMDRWVPYPFQNNIRHLPKEVMYECLTGLLEAQKTPGKGQVCHQLQRLDRRPVRGWHGKSTS